MADAFTSGLAIGLVLLAVMLLVFNTSWTGVGYASSTGWFTPRSSQPELVIADLGQSYQVGRVVTETVDALDLGRFDISAVAASTVLPNGLVQSGALFGERTLRYNVYNPELLRFTVYDTNNYAPLVVKANGRVVAEHAFELGEHVIPLHMEGPVEIELSTPSSAWRLWAPSLYEIHDVVVQTTHPAVEFNFVPGEDFVRGELVLYFDSQYGGLSADLNGRTVWRGQPMQPYRTISFNNAVPGAMNTLYVEAAPGSSFSGRAELRLFYRNVEDRAYEAVFNLTAEQLEKLPGHVTFEVTSAQHKGSIIVELVSGDQTKLAQSIDVEVGSHAVAFWKSNIVPGKLTHLVIRGSDGALFWMRNLKVWV